MAIESISQLMKGFESDKVREFRKKDSPLNIQIIPNVKRIKVEKVAVALEMAAAATQNNVNESKNS